MANGGGFVAFAVRVLKALLITLVVGAFVLIFVVPALFRCVAAGTLVLTPAGPRPIETLQAGDAILSLAPDGRLTEARVSAVRRGVASSWRRLSIGADRSLELTGTHPVAVSAGWRSAGELRPGDEVRAPGGLVALTATEARFGLTVVYDLTVEPHENFIAAGVIVHNKSIRTPEAGAVGDSRAVGSSEVAYASANEGFFGHLTCLSAPTHCGWQAGTTPFLDAQLASLTTKQGYVRSFIPGKPGKGKPDRGMETFVYVATPVKLGETGNRSFAIDHTGLICFTTTASPPPIVNGALDPSCTPLK